MLVQILASSAWTGVVCTISVPKTSNSSAALAPEPSPTPPTIVGSEAISSRKWFSAIRSGTWETNRFSPTRKSRRCSRYPATHSVVPGATVERSTMDWPSRSTGSRSSIAWRIWEMSISTLTCAGVPSVSTTWSARAASWTWGVRVRLPRFRTRSSSSWVPRSWNGIWPAATDSSTDGTRSTPMTLRPRSANDSASGSPTRPRPTTATVAVTGRSLRGGPAPLAKELTREAGQELGIEVEVARQQAARLLGDPVGPLEAALLHPARGLGDAAGVEVEGGAYAAHHRHVEALAHAGHPLLLLRHADAHPEHIRAGGVDLLDDRVLLVRAEGPERGRVAAHDLEAGVAAAHAERELHQRALVAPAVEPHPVALLHAAAVVAEHQLGPVDTVRKVLSQEVRGPHERHPV